MKVVFLIDGWDAGRLKFFLKLRRRAGEDAYLLFCNNQGFSGRDLFWSLVGSLRGIGVGASLRFLWLWLKRKVRFFGERLGEEKSLRWLSKLEPDVGLHKMGVIYRGPVIEKFRLGILNPHIGILPEMRGRSVMEWSILLGVPTGVTTFFVDEGIDTGERIVLKEEIDVSGFSGIGGAKEFLFGKDEEMFERALGELGVRYQVSGFRGDGFEKNEVEKGKRYYVMSGLLRGVVEESLDG